MITKRNHIYHDKSEEEIYFDKLKSNIKDPLGYELANNVEWINLQNFSKGKHEKYPIAITGNGPPILLLHGFDSSFLEFRRLAPLLKGKFKLIIPDLYGFGFGPRPNNSEYGPDLILRHLSAVIKELFKDQLTGIIGASMGGAVAMELARLHPKEFNRLLLLAPAGLTGKSKPIPPPLDQLGVCFLSQDSVRKGLCRQAFANPKTSVGEPEEQIASIHLTVPGWRRSLASFARSGGFANCGRPLPSLDFHVMWGQKDRILKGKQKQDAKDLLEPYIEELKDCGHLPHLDKPKIVAERWIKGFPHP